MLVYNQMCMFHANKTDVHTSKYIKLQMLDDNQMLMFEGKKTGAYRDKFNFKCT